MDPSEEYHKISHKILWIIAHIYHDAGMFLLKPFVLFTFELQSIKVTPMQKDRTQERTGCGTWTRLSQVQRFNEEACAVCKLFKAKSASCSTPASHLSISNTKEKENSKQNCNFVFRLLEFVFRHCCLWRPSQTPASWDAYHAMSLVQFWLETFVAQCSLSLFLSQNFKLSNTKCKVRLRLMGMCMHLAIDQNIGQNEIPDGARWDATGLSNLE